MEAGSGSDDDDEAVYQRELKAYQRRQQKLKPKQHGGAEARAALHARMHALFVAPLQHAVPAFGFVVEGADDDDESLLFESPLYRRVEPIMAAAASVAQRPQHGDAFQMALAGACARPPWPALTTPAQRRAYTVDTLVLSWTQRFGVSFVAAVPLAPSGHVVFLFEQRDDTHGALVQDDSIALAVVTQLRNWRDVLEKLFTQSHQTAADVIPSAFLGAHAHTLGPTETSPEGAACLHEHAQLEYLTYAFVPGDLIGELLEQ